MSAIYPRAVGALILGLLSASVNGAAAQLVNVSLQWLYPVETMFVSDFTPYTVGQNPDFLGINLMTSVQQTVRLELRVSMERPTQRLIFTGTSDPFVLVAPVRRITNRDLARSGSDVSLKSYDIGEGAEDLVQNGTLPAGAYLFTVTVRNALGVQLGSGETRLQIGNPSRIDLLSPGRPSAEPPALITTPSPRFLWSTDGTVAGAGLATYSLRVTRADGAATGEDAMQGFASWETVTSETSAIYPGSAAALPLEPGGTYAWQVVREVRSTTGVQRIESPIYMFRMAASASGGSGVSGTAGAAADRMAALRLVELLRALGLGVQLGGYTRVTGVLVDGRAVPIDGVEELLAAIVAGEVALLSIRLR